MQTGLVPAYADAMIITMYHCILPRPTSTTRQGAEYISMYDDVCIVVDRY